MAEQNTSSRQGLLFTSQTPPLATRAGLDLAATLLALVLALAACCGGLAGTTRSTRRCSVWAGWMPADQTLVAKEVTGSVKNGGRIGWLQWQSPTMKVEVREAQIGWQFRPLLLSRTLKLGEVHIAELRISSTPTPTNPPANR
jgi:translocation and assembly module TamB